jgi:hypothetical protein
MDASRVGIGRVVPFPDDVSQMLKGLALGILGKIVTYLSHSQQPKGHQGD